MASQESKDEKAEARRNEAATRIADLGLAWVEAFLKGEVAIEVEPLSPHQEVGLGFRIRLGQPAHHAPELG